MPAARTTLTGRLAVPGRPGLWCHTGTVTAYPTLPVAAADDATMAGAITTAVNPDGTWTLELLHYRDPRVAPQLPADTATWMVRFERLRARVDGQDVVVELYPIPVDPPAGDVAFSTIQPARLPNGQLVIKGDTGPTPDLQVGTVDTAPTGAPATATITGTPEQPILNLELPRGGTGEQGDTGPTPALTVTAATGPAGSSATVAQTGPPEAPTLAFTLPRGDTGQQGVPGNPTAYDLRGTGMPEGVVTATVGTRYTDTAATNGAIVWVKASGAGATGWLVAEGDTGWRDLTATVDSTRWSATPGAANYIRVRRVGGIVYWTSYLARTAGTGLRISANEGIICTVPSGFVTYSGGGDGGVVSGSTYQYANTQLGGDIRVLSSGAWTAADSVRVALAVPTSTAWPTVLPGTPFTG